MKKTTLLTIVLATAVSCVRVQSQIPPKIEAGLSNGKLSISEVLSNPSYLGLHTDASFNGLIKKYAKQESIVLVTTVEPGNRIIVTGKIADKNNKPLSNALLYVYQTDDRGLYSNPKSEGSFEGDNRHPYLFGYLRSMTDGSFRFTTIQPQGYPGADIPQHIHLEIFGNHGGKLLVTELLFEDDKRLTVSVREQMIKGGYYVAANSGTSGEPVYNYTITLP